MLCKNYYIFQNKNLMRRLARFCIFIKLFNVRFHKGQLNPHVFFRSHAVATLHMVYSPLHTCERMRVKKENVVLVLLCKQFWPHEPLRHLARPSRTLTPYNLMIGTQFLKRIKVHKPGSPLSVQAHRFCFGSKHCHMNLSKSKTNSILLSGSYHWP